LNFNKLLVYDFETDSPHPETAQPVQLASLVLDSRTLEIIPNSEFVTTMRPEDIDEPTYFTEHRDTIEWHAKVNKKTPEEILQEWKDSIPQKLAWESWVTYIERYHKGGKSKSKFTAPILCGMNIIRFDCLISDRLAQKYGNLDAKGENKLFHPRDRIDLLNVLFQWFENLDDLAAYNMDALRDYFGLSSSGAHNALKDVQDTALLIQKFLKLNRTVANRVKFKNSCLN
jgi:exonuclease I